MPRLTKGPGPITCPKCLHPASAHLTEDGKRRACVVMMGEPTQFHEMKMARCGCDEDFTWLSVPVRLPVPSGVRPVLPDAFEGREGAAEREGGVRAPDAGHDLRGIRQEAVRVQGGCAEAGDNRQGQVVCDEQDGVQQLGGEGGSATAIPSGVGT